MPTGKLNEIARIDLDHLNRCIEVLEQSYGQMKKSSAQDISFDIYLSACIKEFEIILEQSGKLLKKRLGDFFSSNKEVDKLTFKDIFRYSAKHGLMSLESCERWLKYRDNRNNTAHDYGKGFAEETLKLLDEFIVSAKEVSKILQKGNLD